MNNKVLQICGAISSLPVQEAWNNFNSVEEALREKYPGVVVINPLKLCDHLTSAYGLKEPPYRHYLDICITSLTYINALVVMDNAHTSIGCQEELKEAYKLGKDLIALRDIL